MHFSVLFLIAPLAPVLASAGKRPHALFDHVLVISIDGFHNSDLTQYVSTRPKSVLATLLKTAYRYTNASTSAPSDSFPGTCAAYTGGTPDITSVW